MQISGPSAEHHGAGKEFDYEERVSLRRGDLVATVTIVEGLVGALRLLPQSSDTDQQIETIDRALNGLFRAGGEIPQSARHYAGTEWRTAILYCFRHGVDYDAIKNQTR